MVHPLKKSKPIKHDCSSPCDSRSFWLVALKRSRKSVRKRAKSVARSHQHEPTRRLVDLGMGQHIVVVKSFTSFAENADISGGDVANVFHRVH